MFNIDGDTLNIPLDLTLDDVSMLKGFIEPRLEFIEEIGIEGDEKIVSSSLIQLLVSIKKAKPNIKIGLLDTPNYNAGTFGTMHWKY